MRCGPLRWPPSSLTGSAACLLCWACWSSGMTWRSLARPMRLARSRRARWHCCSCGWTAGAPGWIGSVPFMLGLLVFWNDMAQPRTPDATCAFEACALALLLLWMNCWRAVFAGRLDRQLGGGAGVPGARRRLWRLVSSEAFFGGTKPMAMALAAGVVLPLPWMAAFYRSAAVLADREDTDLAQLMTKARKLAGFEQRQGWGILLLLTVLYLILLLNVLILLAVLPQLVRILTGYESVFSRGATYYVSNSLFWLAAMTLAWMAFDPFTQAVYCLRSFQLESRGTGEDLRAALRMVVS